MNSLDYRKYLNDELEKRMAKNPSYSLRAFAKHLGITPQMLSFVMNKKKNISMEMAAQIAERLDLDPTQANYFLNMVELAKAKNPVSRKLIEARLNGSFERKEGGFHQLAAEQFKVISDWCHYAILELTQTKNFQANPEWIAKRLGIRPFEVKQAIARLKMLELLDETDDGQLIRTELNITANYSSPNAPLRKLAKQYLEKAVDALENQPQEERDITNMTMSIDPTRIPEAKEMIAEFRRKLCEFLEQGERTQVYVFSPVLIRLTEKTEEN